MFTLDGKIVLVTGAAGGIGAALVEAFHAAGAKVAAADLNHEQVAVGLDRSSDRLLVLALDVTDPDGVGRAIGKISERFGQIDVLVNNAGVKSSEKLLTGNPQIIDRTIEINADAVLSLSRAVFAHSMISRGGRIINIGSSISSKGAVFNYQAGGADYCYSKAMVHDLTKLLAFEGAPYGVTVNAVAPGIIHTPMHGRPAEETEARHAGRIPLGRIGLPKDLAGAVLFLASDEAAYVTGQILHVNGGMVMAG